VVETETPVDSSQYIGLVEALANKWVRKLPDAIEFEELRGIGFVALQKAVLSYDDSLGVPFGAYAYTRVDWGMLDAMRKLPRWVRGKGLQYLEVSLNDAVDGRDDALTWDTILCDPATDLIAEVEARDLARTVKKVASDLPDNTAKRVILSMLAGVKQNEIARRMDRTPQRVGQLAKKAKSHLLRRLRMLNCDWSDEFRQ
jgi:RNA polymerase sigma factor (sigma-70 family)